MCIIKSYIRKKYHLSISVTKNKSWKKFCVPGPQSSRENIYATYHLLGQEVAFGWVNMAVFEASKVVLLASFSRILMFFKHFSIIFWNFHHCHRFLTYAFLVCNENSLCSFEHLSIIFFEFCTTIKGYLRMLHRLQ